MNFQETFQTILLPALIRLGLAILTLLVGRWLARRGRGWLHATLEKTDLTASLVTLFTTLTFYGIWVMTILTALAVLGVPVNYLVTVGGVVFIVLGIAMQQSLANFAATVIFLLFKPFQVGDLIETSGTTGTVTGTVTEIQLFNTVLQRADGKVVTLPNAKIQGDGITNYSKADALRVDLVFGISYSDDIRQARRIAEEVLAADDRILRDPPPQVAVLELAESRVNLAVRPFAKLEDYWQVQLDLQERIKARFDEEGISIPFPQRDIHVTQAG